MSRNFFLIIILNLTFADEQKSFLDASHPLKNFVIQKALFKPQIDGFLNDSAWFDVPTISDFVQDEPFNLATPSERTEVKVIYDEESIYIAASINYKSKSDVTRHMVRRDEWRRVMMSDWFSVEIDSYHDHQTAFEFLVNSMGIQFDDMVYDDIDRNTDWNAIWDSDVSESDTGWNVEIKIPFSALRFSDSSELTMGINFNRYIQSKNELVSWIVFPRDYVGISSKFGHMTGLKNLKKTKLPISIRPYINSGVYEYDNYHLIDRDSPYSGKQNKNAMGNENKLGLDIKYLITQDFIADLTFNPDYGQIEADPADINITYFETYFLEKRPFFMENATLFDTPVEVFYSRRIGTNRQYVLGKWQPKMNSIVKYAGKITGKTKNGLSLGIISAVTNDETRSWSETKSNSNFFVTRLTQDVLEGNSYLGFLSTIYNDTTTTNSVNSIDMLSNLFDNELMIDWQIIKTRTNSLNSSNDSTGNGLSLEVHFNPSHLNSHYWINIEYFDKFFDIDDIGYLYRNNLKKLEGGFGFFWPELNFSYPIIETKIDFYFDYSKNLNDLVLANIFGLSGYVTFSNLWNLGGNIKYLNTYYDDLLLYDYYKKTLGPSVLIPKSISSEFFIENSFSEKISFNCNVTNWYNNHTYGSSGSILIGFMLSERLDASFNYIKSQSEEKYRWIESYYPLGIDNSMTQYIFAFSENKIDKYIYEVNYSLNRKLNFQFYLEYYTNYNNFGDFYKYDSEERDYDFIEQDEYYISYQDLLSGNFYNDERPLNPQDHVFHYTRDQIMNTNFVIHYEISNGSNAYLVYSIYQDVMGRRISSFDHFRSYIPAANDLSETNFTQSINIKIDYWFDL